MNPAFAKYVVSVAEPLPPSYAKCKIRLLRLEKGLTVHGTVRQNPSPRSRKFGRGKM